MIEFKGSNEGIRMIIGGGTATGDAEALRDRLREKLKDIGAFLSGATITVEVVAEALTASTAEIIISTLTEHSDMTLREIRCRREITDDDEGISIGVPAGHSTRDSAPAGPVDWVDFHLSTVRGGQSIHSPRSLVVMGSVNPGGSVTAVGNIYILGSLGGVAHAGYAGDDETWIYARVMNPLQLRIGEHLARSEHDEEGDQPECAVVDEGRICVYPASHLQDLAIEQVGRRTGDHLNVAESDI